MGGHLLDQLLVHRVEVGVNKADGDRLHPLINELLDRARDIAKRFDLVAVGADRRKLVSEFSDECRPIKKG